MQARACARPRSRALTRTHEGTRKNTQTRVMLIDFPLQQWLEKALQYCIIRALYVHYTCIASLLSSALVCFSHYPYAYFFTLFFSTFRPLHFFASLPYISLFWLPLCVECFIHFSLLPFFMSCFLYFSFLSPSAFKYIKFCCHNSVHTSYHCFHSDLFCPHLFIHCILQK